MLPHSPQSFCYLGHIGLAIFTLSYLNLLSPYLLPLERLKKVNIIFLVIFPFMTVEVIQLGHRDASNVYFAVFMGDGRMWEWKIDPKLLLCSLNTMLRGCPAKVENMLENSSVHIYYRKHFP